MNQHRCHITDEGVVGLSGPNLKGLLTSFLQKGQSCRMRVNGTSMTPFIRHGDIACIEPLRAAPRVGDVVAAATDDGGRVILHRVVKIRKTGGKVRILLRGDSGCEGADWTSESAVLGRVAEVSRMGRRQRIGGGLLGGAGAMLARRLSSLRRKRRH